MPRLAVAPACLSLPVPGLLGQAVGKTGGMAMALRGLAGKAVLVTGAAGGIGAATVRRLLDEDCRVLAMDRDAAGLELLGADAPPANLRLRAGDVSDENSVHDAAQECVSAFGGLDLCFANAGILGVRVPIAEMSLAQFDAVHAVNVRGVFLTLRAALHRMIAQGTGGAIVCTASVGGLRGFRNSAAYGSLPSR